MPRPRDTHSMSGGPRRRRRYVPMFHRLAALNALVVLAAVALTIVVLAPGKLSELTVDAEVGVLLGAVVLVVFVNVLLLRRVTGPLQALTALELRPEALDDLGLASALAVLCERFSEHSGLAVSERITEPLPALPPEAELVIYRVAQEALTNIARHSGSKRAELTLAANHGRVWLTVRDWGRGLDAHYVPGSGIRGMRERAALLGSTVEIR